MCGIDRACKKTVFREIPVRNKILAVEIWKNENFGGQNFKKWLKNWFSRLYLEKLISPLDSSWNFTSKCIFEFLKLAHFPGFYRVKIIEIPYSGNFETKKISIFELKSWIIWPKMIVFDLKIISWSHKTHPVPRKSLKTSVEIVR